MEKMDLREEINKLYVDDVQQMYDTVTDNIKALCNKIDANISAYSIDELEQLLTDTVAIVNHIETELQLRGPFEGDVMVYQTCHDDAFINVYREQLEAAAEGEDKEYYIHALFVHERDRLENFLKKIELLDEYKTYITAEIQGFSLID